MSRQQQQQQEQERSGSDPPEQHEQHQIYRERQQDWPPPPAGPFGPSHEQEASQRAADLAEIWEVPLELGAPAGREYSIDVSCGAGPNPRLAPGKRLLHF